MSLGAYLTPDRTDVIHARKLRERMNARLRTEMAINDFTDKQDRRIERRERRGE